MTSRNRRGNRQANLKARLSIAAAVLAGGGAIGVAVAASGHGVADSAASAGYSTRFHHTFSQSYALDSALSQWQWSHGRSLNTLSQMAPLKTFSQTWHGGTEFAAQRGIVELATKKFLLVKSANGQLELWWLGHTKASNVSASLTGLTVLTGSRPAALALLLHNNLNPAVSTMAGGMNAANTMTAPTTPSTTVSVNTGTATVTVTITGTSATVSTPATTPATTSGTSLTSASSSTTASGPMVTTRQPTFAAASGIARGDLVFVAGVKEHGFLVAKLALFAPTTTATVTPTASATPTMGTTVAPTSTTTAVPSTQNGVVMGTHS